MVARAWAIEIPAICAVVDHRLYGRSVRVPDSDVNRALVLCTARKQATGKSQAWK
jgi:hypothetical protein